MATSPLARAVSEGWMTFHKLDISYARKWRLWWFISWLIWQYDLKLTNWRCFCLLLQRLGACSPWSTWQKDENKIRINKNKIVQTRVHLGAPEGEQVAIFTQRQRRHRRQLCLWDGNQGCNINNHKKTIIDDNYQDNHTTSDPDGINNPGTWWPRPSPRSDNQTKISLRNQNPPGQRPTSTHRWFYNVECRIEILHASVFFAFGNHLEWFVGISVLW